MDNTPGKNDHDNAEPSPEGGGKYRTALLVGIAVIIAAVLIFVVASAFLN